MYVFILHKCGFLMEPGRDTLWFLRTVFTKECTRDGQCFGVKKKKLNNNN